ncbi:TPA: hypothetical protein MM329_000676 [Escherichia coli]|nr:hypothetical protein [Escherichia coli]HBZ8229042.1 hypothetical protein [Escherichia coli]HBZ8345770.1 hypothetical protein [Escherichia coli]HBZ8350839.1 hypothetical protein [Escherichia coli]HBZ8356171.1 hypothetical protein [Escherichia coli]
MFKFDSDLTKLLNKYVNSYHVYGQNDCNILVADYIDMVCNTDYKSKLQNQYTTPKEGLEICEKLTGFNNVLEACEKHLEQSDTIENGSVLLIKKTLGKKTYYVSTIVFRNKALTEYENKYVLTSVKDFDYELIFNRRK